MLPIIRLTASITATQRLRVNRPTQVRANRITNAFSNGRVERNQITNAFRIENHTTDRLRMEVTTKLEVIVCYDINSSPRECYADSQQSMPTPFASLGLGNGVGLSV